MKYDFSGYATKNDLECSDGRIIRHGAFKGDDKRSVPLVWNHNHDSVENVLGNVVLENRHDGVYAYGSFNNSPHAQHAKELLRHGDIKALSICANKLKQQGREVLHGSIREVSLVLAGANPGAFIQDICIEHSDGTEMILEDEAIIYTGSPISTMMNHAEEEKTETETETKTKTETTSDEDGSDDETVEDVFNTLSEKQKNVVYYLIAQAVDGDDVDIEHADGDDEGDGETIEDVFNTLSEKQKNVVYYLIGQAVKENDSEDVDVEEVDEEEVEMKHNIFDEDSKDTINHTEILSALDEAEQYGTMKASFLQHGIEDIEVLFPEARTVTPTPDMITRQMGWVTEVLNATKKSPFSRIKSVAANLTEDEARAKGYIKGNEKAEEKFGLLKRVTTPQTIYKKQALDRDDIIDITDFDVVVWLKAEMRMMLDEELARAILVSDGRSKGHADKINEENIRPIYQDDDLYTIHYAVDVTKASSDDELSALLIDSAVRSRKEYRGTGNPVMYASTDVINDMLLARDKIGHRLYGNESELAAALRVSKIVEVPVLEGVQRTDSENKKFELLALIVNLSDYTIGADKGGEVNFFDDFDIDFNKEKYLIETRCSATLTHPYSAIALEKPVGATAQVSEIQG